MWKIIIGTSLLFIAVLGLSHFFACEKMYIYSSLGQNFTAFGAFFSSLVFFVMYFQLRESIKTSEYQLINNHFMSLISIITAFRNEIIGYYPNSSCAITRSVGLQNIFLKLMHFYKNSNAEEFNSQIISVSEDTNIIPYFYSLCSIVSNMPELKYTKKEEYFGKVMSVLSIEEKIILYFFSTIKINEQDKFITVCNEILGKNLNKTEIKKYLDYGWTRYAISSSNKAHSN